MPKAGLVLVSNEWVLYRVIDGQNKLLDSFTYTFKVLDVVRLRHVNLLVLYVFGYANHRLLEVSSIEEKMFQQSIKENGIEVTIP